MNYKFSLKIGEKKKGVFVLKTFFYCIFVNFHIYLFSRIRMWWLYLVLQTIVTVVGIWLLYWRLGRIWTRIFCSLIQPLGKLNLTPHARLLIIFCNFHISFIYLSAACNSLFFCCVIVDVSLKRGVLLFFKLRVIINMILLFGVCPAAALLISSRNS